MRRAFSASTARGKRSNAHDIDEMHTLCQAESAMKACCGYPCWTKTTMFVVAYQPLSNGVDRSSGKT